MAAFKFSSSYTLEIPKLEPALFGLTKHGNPTFLIILSVTISSL